MQRLLHTAIESTRAKSISHLDLFAVLLQASAALMQFAVSCDFFIGDMGRVSYGKNLAVKKLKKLLADIRTSLRYVRSTKIPKRCTRFNDEENSEPPFEREKESVEQVLRPLSSSSLESFLLPFNANYADLISQRH